MTEVKPEPCTCQICGRTIKAKTGVIAHHGYQRPGNGWQTSSCMGARHLPYEQSCDLIPVAIQSAQEFIDRVTALVDDMKANPPDHVMYAPRRTYSVQPEPIRVDRPADFKVDGHRSYRPAAYDTIFHARYSDLESSVRFARIDLDYLTKRLANWKPPVIVAAAE